MSRFHAYIETHLSLFLLIGVGIGLILPAPGIDIGPLVMFLVGTLIFLSCADIKQETVEDVDVYQVALFSLTRFAIFPLLLYFLGHLLVPELALGILLLAVMPAGVSVASLCSMSGGNVVIGLSITMVSTLMAPFIATGIFGFLGHQIEIDILSLFFTLGGIVFVPVMLYLLVNHYFPGLKVHMRKNNKPFSVLLFAFVLMLIVASQKSAMFNDFTLMITGLLVLTVLYAAFYLYGFVWAIFMKPHQRISYIYASGANNNLIALGLAVVYFSPVIALFIAMSELVWSFYIAVTQYVFQRQAKNKAAQTNHSGTE